LLATIDNFGQNAADGEFQPDGLIETVDSSAGTFPCPTSKSSSDREPLDALKILPFHRKIRDSKKLEILMEF
jgi:hypothetical protein